MGTTYFKAGKEVQEILDQVVRQWHPDMAEAEVKIGVIFAMNKKEGESAVKHGGYPAAATVRIVSLKDRVTKGIDVEILVDAEGWKDLPERRKIALLDHECRHLAVKREKVKPNSRPRNDEGELEDVEEEVTAQPKGDIQRDDLGRPMLKLVKGDWNGGDGFRDVLIRHGDFAPESLNAKAVQLFIDSCMAESVA